MHQTDARWRRPLQTRTAPNDACSSQRPRLHAPMRRGVRYVRSSPVYMALRPVGSPYSSCSGRRAPAKHAQIGSRGAQLAWRVAADIIEARPLHCRSRWGRTCSASSDATSLTAAAAADAMEATLSVNFRKKLILGCGEVVGDGWPQQPMKSASPVAQCTCWRRATRRSIELARHC